MNTTVSMSLERFKELESKEQSFETLIRSPEYVIIYSQYGHTVVSPVTIAEALEKKEEEIRKVKEQGEQWRLKCVQLDEELRQNKMKEIRNSFWK